MEARYNVTGARRKELVKTIENLTGARSEYRGAPTFAYGVDVYTVTKDGTLVIPDDCREAERILGGIAEAGFEMEAADDWPVGLTVSVPADKVNLGNLTRLLEAKGGLIRKALGISSLPVEAGEDAVSFPWFGELPDADEAAAYTHLIAELCRMSREQTRINATAKEVENEKYAFRCFLLRLGFIGDEYKKERKILLRNLSGSSAFKGGAGA